MPNQQPSLSDFYDMSETEKLNTIWIGLTEIWNKLSELERDNVTQNNTLYKGNGELPLVEQVRNNTDFIKSLKYWAKFLVGALIAQTIAFFFGVVVALIRFLPVLERLAAHP